MSVILSLLITLELVSINMGGNLIDYRFYEHLDIETVWSVKDFFSSSILTFTIIFIAICFFLFKVSRWLYSKNITKWMYSLMIGLGLLLMSLNNGVVKNIYDIVNLKTTKAKSFDKALEDLGIDPMTYVTSDEITATAGKNIIVLSLESLERGYLEPPLEKLTPNLNELAKENTYIPMEESDGSHWTTASIYSSITGMPAYFKSEGNSIFQNAKSSKISNVGSVLNSAGYDVSYLIGNKEFSGINDMLKTFGFNVKSEIDFETKYEKINWGIHDKDLFAEAKKEILSANSTEKPFALFLSTISGHYPNGVYDKRMEGVLPKQDSDIEFMATAIDYYIGNLIAFLKENELYENTAIFIFPDHKLMFEKSDVINKFKNERGLYLISNQNSKQALQGVQEPYIQLDIPRIILDGAGVKTNAKFLIDYIEGDKTTFLNQNKPKILSLNEASLKRNYYNDGFDVTWDRDEKQIIIKSLTSNTSNVISNVEPNTLYKVNFQNDMRFHSSIKISHNESESGFVLNGYSDKEINQAFAKKSTPTLTFSVIGDSIFSYFQKGKVLGIAKSDNTLISFSKNDLSIFNNWKNIQPSKDLNKDKIYLRSTSYTNQNAYGKSRIFTGLKPQEVTRGLNLLFIENNTYVVKNYDTYGNADDSIALIKMLELLFKNGTEFSIIAHDSAENKLDPIRDALADFGLNVLSDIQKREAYIGYYKDGKIVEEKDSRSLTLELDLTKLPSNPDIETRKKDVSRFIAHAGGVINGETYTNSLEALNLSYEKGYRLFELDIIKTLDNYFVSAHDWKHWSQKTKYTGELPPTRKIFLKNPIKEYTPLDMGAINNWFKSHPDAILVTDKVNTPKEFAKKFIDKSRLMMELFSIEALKEAKLTGIKAVLASENVIKKLRGKELETLKKLGVNYIAISRRSILDNVGLLKELKRNEIKTYVYNVNFDEGRDENYVAEIEMDYIYGMYADEWDFRE